MMKRMFGCRYTAFPPANTFDPGTRENGSAVVKPVLAGLQARRNRLQPMQVTSTLSIYLRSLRLRSSLRLLLSDRSPGGDTLHTAHDAPLGMPDRSRAEPLHLHAAGAQAGAARARDDRPARGGGAEAWPAKIRAVSYEAAI